MKEWTGNVWERHERGEAIVCVTTNAVVRSGHLVMGGGDCLGGCPALPLLAP